MTVRPIGAPDVLTSIAELKGFEGARGRTHLWVPGGNQHQTQTCHSSKLVGLQLKARYQGVPTPVYGQAQVHLQR